MRKNTTETQRNTERIPTVALFLVGHTVIQCADRECCWPGLPLRSAAIQGTIAWLAGQHTWIDDCLNAPEDELVIAVLLVPAGTVRAANLAVLHCSGVVAGPHAWIPAPTPNSGTRVPPLFDPEVALSDCR